MNIQKATLADVDDIIALNQELFHHDFKFDNTLDITWPSHNRKYYTGRIKNNNSLVLIVKIGKETIAYLITNIANAEEYRTVKKIIELENMLVKSEYRGKKIGSKLIQEACAWGKSKGIKKAKIIASSLNKAAIHVYKKNKFKEYNICLEADI